MSTTVPQQQRLPGAEFLQHVADYLSPVKTIVGAATVIFGAYFALFGRGTEQVAGLVALLAGAAVTLLLFAHSKPRAIQVPDVPAIRGSAPYNEHDASRFFERASETGRLVGAVQDDTRRITLLQGVPSSGKTSLLRAGLAPRLEVSTWIPVYAAVSERADPLDDLRRKLAEASGLSTGAELPLPELIRQVTTATKRTAVLIIDQMERLFSSHEAARHRAPLLKALRASLDDPQSATRLVLCISSGFDDGVRELEKSLDEVITARFDITRFVPDRAARLLEAMAAYDGTPFTPGLRSAIVHDLIRGDDETICPAELQAVSTWLRDLRICTLAGYERSGRAAGLFRQHVQEIVAPIDSATSVGPARHILTVLSDRALLRPDGNATVAEIIDTHGDPHRATGLLQREALEEALVRLVDDHLVRRVTDDRYALIHSYFARDIQSALRRKPGPALKMWWLVRSILVAYSLRSVGALAAVVVCASAALIALSAPGAQPRWDLDGPTDTLGRDAVWAFGPNNTYLAADIGSEYVVWDLLPDRMLALDVPSRKPVRTLPHQPKSAGNESNYVPLSVGFLADESEAYGVSLDTHLNRWRVDRVRLKDTNDVEPLAGTLSPPTGARCTPKAAAWSLKLDALAIAYSCGQIVFEPTGPSFIAMDNNNTLGSEQSMGDTADDLCEPTKMALNGGESRLVVAYRCTRQSDLRVHSKLVTWGVGRKTPVLEADVPFDEAADNDVKVLMFRWDGHVTAGFGTMSDLTLYDVSNKPKTLLVENSGNQLNPRLVWFAPDGRLLAVQGDTPELRLQVVDLWLGPVRVPPMLPFRQQLADIKLNF